MRQPTTDNRQPLRLAFKLGGLALMSAVLITACRKEEPSPTLPGATSDAAQVNPTPRIKAFIERALVGDAKSGGTLSVDSAVWYVEAALNYSLTQTWIQASDGRLDSATISIPFSVDQVSGTDASTAYLQLAEALNSFIVEGESHLALVDVSPVLHGAEIELRTYVHVGSGYGKSVNANYGEDDYFDGYGPLSHCGCGPNQGEPGLCADKQIQARVNFALVHPANSYWTNVQYNQLTSWNTPAGSIWHCEGTIFQPCDACFTPSMLSQYTQGAWDVIWLYVPTGKEPIRTTVQGSGFVEPPEGHIQFHEVVTRYGINVPLDQ